MPEYIKCPRCELNYIKKGEQYCQVCKAELKLGPQLMFAVDEDDEDYENQKLCPICKQNYIDLDMEMCDQCKEDQANSTEEEVDIEKDEEWKNFVNDEDLIPTAKDNDEEMISLSKLEEDEVKELYDD